MSKFCIWWVEDRTTAEAEEALFDAFGPCCHINVFRSGTEAIQLLTSASDISELPNVSLIDLRLTESEDPTIIGEDKDGRGFIVAAELSHKATVLNLASDEIPRFKLYTGSEDVFKKYGAAAGTTPLGHPALLRLEFKGALESSSEGSLEGSLEEDKIIGWAVEELHAIALHRLRFGKSGITTQDIAYLQKEYVEILAQSEKANKAYLRSYKQVIAPALAQFIQAVEESENSSRQLLTSLKEAKDVGKILSILGLSNEWPGRQLLDFKRKIKEFQQISEGSRAKTDSNSQIENRLGELCLSPLIASGDGPLAELFPYEVNALLKDGEVGIWLPALGKIMEMLSSIDYNLLLARAFKKLQIDVETQVERQAVTAFAYVTHEIHKLLRSCTHCFKESARTPDCITPDTGDFIQNCPLNALEWQGGPIKESALAKEVKVLPEGTIKRIKRDGLDFVDGLPERAVPHGPLLSFAARYEYEGEFSLGDTSRRARENWHERWGEKLGLIFGPENVKTKYDSEQEPWFLTDWREFFGSADDRHKGLLVELHEEIRTDGQAEVEYQNDGDVIITLSWPKADFKAHKVDQVRPEKGKGGGLAIPLQALNKWGNVVVRIKNERQKVLKLTTIPFIPGEQRKHEDTNTDPPGFQVIWRLTNYLEKREWKT